MVWIASLLLLGAGAAGPEGEENTMPKKTEIVLDAREQRIHDAFNELSKENMEVLDDFYDEAVVFKDPLTEIEGLPDLIAYYAEMYKNVQEIAFEFDDFIHEGDRYVGLWTMRMKVKSLNGGEEISVVGNSVIVFGESDKVVYHRDYFDVGAMLYEHVPVVKFFVNQVKKRVADH